MNETYWVPKETNGLHRAFCNSSVTDICEKVKLILRQAKVFTSCYPIVLWRCPI